MRNFCKWLWKLVTLQPHLKIGGTQPYMLRWYLIPRNPWLNVYLHKFLRDDDDRALHDHPWKFISFMLWGVYSEQRHGHKTLVRSAPSLAYRDATDRHCITLLRNKAGQEMPCWTIVLTGPKIREWGFWCPKGFVVWTDFVDVNDEGNIGKGCGE